MTAVALLLSAVVLYVLGFAPFAFAPAGWIALAPWCLIARRWSGRRLFFGSYLAGALIFTAGCHWLALTTPVNLVLMVVVEALAFALFAVILRLLLVRGGVPATVAVPAVFVPIEWLRGLQPFHGFPWLFLGYSQADLPWVLALAQFAAVHGVSAFCALTAGFLIDLGDALMRKRAQGADAMSNVVPRRWFLGTSAAVLALVVVVGAWAPTHEPGPDSRRIRILLVQGNVPQALKNNKAFSLEEILQRYLETMGRALRDVTEPVDVVLWPETMYPIDLGRAGTKRNDLWYRGPPREVRAADGEGRHARFVEDVVVPLRERWNAQLVVGATTHEGSLERGDHRVFNSAVLFDESGGTAAYYDKVVLVPGGEFVPLLGVMPDSWSERCRQWIVSLAGFFPDLSPGDGPQPMLLTTTSGDRVELGVSICYEIAYPNYSRRLANSGANLLVNLSNEAWFPDSAEYAQYTAMSRFRAVEAGLALVRCANSGESGWVGADGSVELLEVDGRTHDVGGAMVVDVPLGEPGTLYSRIGDAVVAVWTAVAVCLVLCSCRRRGTDRSGPSPQAGVGGPAGT